MKKKGLDPIIKTTKDYSIFKILDGNRRINQLNLKRIIASMKENPLVSIVIVNERMEIIDGQHRFHASKQLKLPINYVIVYGYGIKEVQVLNAIGMNWNKADYLVTYADGGNENYVAFKRFREAYPQLSFTLAVRLLSGLSSHRTKSYEGVKGSTKDFENGNFVVKDLEKSYVIANMILDFAPFFKKYNDLTFCLTLLSIFEQPNYQHDRMLKKLKVLPSALKPCKTQKQYQDLLEEIYNYKSREKFTFRTYLQK
jgi:hypothetical protein